MIEETNSDLILDALVEKVSDLTEIKASMMKEACVWCLLECGHSNGVSINSIICDDSRCYRLRWNENFVDAQKLFKSYNLDDAVEFGAEAVTFLLILELTPYTAIERAVKGTGIDYWLGFKSENPQLIFNENAARLEVSGILREKGSNTLKSRIVKKIKQTSPTDNTFPVYVSIVEFGKPKAEVVMKHAKH